jgi:membrane peptidoglycan carboxypeptidase
MVARKWRLGRVRPNPLGYLLVVMTIIVLLGVLLAGGGAGGVYAASYYQRHIPDIQQLASLRNQANSTIYDRNGTPIFTDRGDSDYQIYVPLSQISEKLQAATIDTEDHTFYTNDGIDLYGTLRAALADVKAGGAAQGGSTITQQLVKNIVLDDTNQTIQRKLNEAILAYGLTQQYTKSFILEMYLNTIPYGELDTGIEAAARNFFHLTPDNSTGIMANQNLDWAQAAILAGLPNAPSEYDPTQFSCAKAPCDSSQWAKPFQGNQQDCGYHIPSFDSNWYATNGHEWLVYCRAELVLYNVYQYGVPGDANADLSLDGYYKALGEVQNILTNQLVYPFQANYNSTGQKSVDLAPHFVQYISDQMTQFGITNLANAGLRIYTTLDLPLQQEAQAVITHYVDNAYKETYYGPTPGSWNYYPALADPTNANAHNGALVAIDQRNGDILAMVGSVDYGSKDPRVLGANNITTSTSRSMGSATKPLMYATAFQMGWTPGVMLQDVPICFPVPAVDPTTNKPVVSQVAPACKGWYVPQDYEATNFSGTFPLRRQFDGSLNIPATEGMEFVGSTPATSTNFLDMVGRLGVTSITKNAMGPTTALGTQDISLLQLTSAYSVFANGGARAPARGILRITRADGTVLWSAPAQPQTQQSISPQAAFMITSVLSDNRARYPFFKLHNPLVLDSYDANLAGVPGYYNTLPIAAKTGTSSGSTGPLDIVTAGYSPYMTLGVWVGNTDGNDPLTPNVIGVTGAGYIFHDVMLWAAQHFNWNPKVSFTIPKQMARGDFNCNTGLAPYQNSTQADLNCAFTPVPKAVLPKALYGAGNAYAPMNPYDPDGDFLKTGTGDRTHMPDVDWYIIGDQPATS